MRLCSRIPPSPYEHFISCGTEPLCETKAAASVLSLRRARRELLELAYSIVAKARETPLQRRSCSDSNDAAGAGAGAGAAGANLDKYAVMKRLHAVLKAHQLEHMTVEWLGPESGRGGSVRERGSLSHATKRKLHLSVALQLFERGDAAPKLESFMAHEVLTHALRAAADWSAPWFGLVQEPKTPPPPPLEEEEEALRMSGGGGSSRTGKRQSKSSSRRPQRCPSKSDAVKSAPPPPLLPSLRLPQIAGRAAAGGQSRGASSGGDGGGGRSDGGGGSGVGRASVRVARYGMAAVDSREVAATEEGLASLNGLMYYPQDPTQRFLLSPALLYIFAAEAVGRTFTELFSMMADTEPDPRSRFFHCVRAKRDTAFLPRGRPGSSAKAPTTGVDANDEGGDEVDDDEVDDENDEKRRDGAPSSTTAAVRLSREERRGGSRVGSNGRGQIYLEGCVAILKEMRTLDDECLAALYGGRVSIKDVATVAKLLRRRRKKQGNNNDTDDGEDDDGDSDGGDDNEADEQRGCDAARRPAALPCFVEKDMASYRNELIAIGVLNGIIAGRALRDRPHVTMAAPSGSPSGVCHGVCLYEKYFGMPSSGAAAPP